MADQNYTAGIRCGFFDSVDDDRLYSADDMNKPYEKLFGNGIISPNESTNAFHVTKSLGSNINITGGNAIFAGKWFELDTALSIHVPANSSEYDRIDSVIAQVDNTLGGRLGQIVYRTGTPSATPVPPPTNTEIGITEYRIANVLMRAGATSPAAGDITDLRGTNECPYIQQIGSAETAWFILTLASGIEGRIRYKRVGKTVFVNGSITSAPAVGDTIGTISAGFRPLWDHVFTTSAINGGAVSASLSVKISTTGAVSILAGSGYSATDSISFSTSFTTA